MTLSLTDQIGDARFQNTSTLSMPPARSDRYINAFGIVDQALLTLFQLKNADRMPLAPRSAALDIIQLYHRFGQSRSALSSASLLVSAAGCVARLAKEWQSTVKESRARVAPDPYRYYKVASLAAASILVPWLLIRKRG